jgi:PAS domain S-box-containing protein
VATPLEDNARDRVVRQCYTASKGLCVVALALPFLAALGWIFEVPLLTQVHVGLPAMQPNTVAGLALASLAVLVTPDRAEVRRYVPVSLATMILLLGLITLAQYAFGWDTGLDRLLLQVPATADQPFPGRPSPQTSLNFALVGFALLAMNLGAWPSVAGQASALFVAANSIAAVTGYIFGTGALYGFPFRIPAIGIAVHTAIAFVLLVVALFCRRPTAGLMTLVTSPTYSGALVRQILMVSLLAPPVIGSATQFGLRLGWYDVSFERALHVLVIGALIVLTTWRAARRSEQAEVRERTVRLALERANGQLKRAVAERQIFAALVENSSDFIGIADPSGKPTYLNSAGRRMIGLEPDFPVDTIAIVDCYTPDQRQFAADVILKEMRERGHWSGETAFRHWKTEAAIPVWDTHFLIRSRDSRKILGLGTITRDISEITRLRRQLELMLVAGEQISEALANVPEQSMRAVLSTVARNAQLLTGAELAAAGVGGDEMYPFDIWTFAGMSPEQDERLGRSPKAIGLLGFVPKLNRALRLRDVREHPDYRGTPPHPQIRSFLGVPIHHAGRALGNLYLANKHGVAEFTEGDQRIAEWFAARAGTAVGAARLYAAEAETRAWLQAVVEQMPEGLILMDAEGRVTIENQKLRMLAASGSGEAAGRFGGIGSLDLRSPSGAPLELEDVPMMRALTDGKVTSGRELLGRRSDGHIVPLLVSAAPITVDHGEPSGAVMILQDISALKELERTREEWASIVAHDLRQPISVITLRTSMLLKAGLPERQRKDVEDIRTSTDRLNRMVSDLMDAALLESRRMQVTLERLDLGLLLHAVVERVPEVAGRVTLRTPPEHVFVRGDAQRLEQVVVNLVLNAVKYGTPGTPIGIDLRDVDGHAEVTVTNRGQGIAPEEVPLVFDRYVRAQAAKSRTRGLGLGLYIARGLVEAHHGRIWVESVPGDRTTFHLAIPLDGPTVASLAVAS